MKELNESTAKKQYSEPKAEVVVFAATVVVTSGGEWETDVPVK